MEEEFKLKDNLSVLSLVPINTKEKDFETLMSIYQKGMFQVKGELETFQSTLKDYYNYDVINNINCRIKTPESIINKMKKKNYDLNYTELINNIDDVAGIRIVCPFKSDIAKVKNSIENNDKMEIIQVKDYLNRPKKSGYSGLHLIVQTPVNIGETDVNIKTEIQIKTMAMDFWSTTEHKIKYKAHNNISKSDSKKMVKYANLINKLDDRISKINMKYEE